MGLDITPLSSSGGVYRLSAHGQFAPWTFCPMYWRFSPLAIRPMDVSSHTRHFTPRAWGKTSMGRNVHTWRETSMGRTVRGAKSPDTSG